MSWDSRVNFVKSTQMSLTVFMKNWKKLWVMHVKRRWVEKGYGSHV